MEREKVEKIKGKLEARTHSLARILNEMVWKSFEETIKDLEGGGLSEKMDNPQEEDYWRLFKLELRGRLEDLLDVF